MPKTVEQTLRSLGYGHLYDDESNRDWFTRDPDLRKGPQPEEPETAEPVHLCHCCGEAFAAKDGYMHVAPDPTVEPVFVCAEHTRYLIHFNEACEWDFVKADRYEPPVPAIVVHTMTKYTFRAGVVMAAAAMLLLLGFI